MSALEQRIRDICAHTQGTMPVILVVRDAAEKALAEELKRGKHGGRLVEVITEEEEKAL
jgi:hypothetical protein